MKRIWVDDNFHKMVKRMSVEKGMSIYKFTKKLSLDDDFFYTEFEKTKVKRGKNFDFGF